MQRIPVAPLIVASLALPVTASGQETEGARWSVGAGISVLTGTPHRPRPPEGYGLTGASGPEQGFHVRAAGERYLSPWLLAGLEASYNRLTTSTPTSNCIMDPGDGRTGTCFPAAGLDEVLALHATVRAEGGGRWAPFVTLGAGAGAFRLAVDEPADDSDLEDRSGVRPAFRIGTGLTYDFGRYRASLEGSFNATIGRGGGTHHIPVTLSLGF